MTTDTKIRCRALVTVSLMGFLWTASPPLTAEVRQPARVIIQGGNVATISTAVRAVGGQVTHELGMIKGIGARLTPAQIRQLKKLERTLRIRPERTTTVSGPRDAGVC